MADGAGDPEAFCRFYDATVERVHSVALRILGDRTVAEEVICEVYIRAWSEAPRRDPQDQAALASILAACRARAVEALRSKTDAAAIADDAGHPELACLTPIERELVTLAFYRGLGLGDLASLFGLSLDAVQDHLESARCKMRTAVPPISGTIAP